MCELMTVETTDDDALSRCCCAGTRYLMTQSSFHVLALLLTMRATVRSNKRGVSVSLADAATALSGSDSRVAEWIKGFDKAPVSEDAGVSTAQVEALLDAMEDVCQVGGSSGGSMKQTFVQGLADLGDVSPFVQEMVGNLCCALTSG